jgi:mono/diheme cytochrome c family protein
MKTINIINSFLASALFFTASCGAFKIARYSADNNPYAGNTVAIAEGLELYKENCSSCHGMSATGDGSVTLQLRDQPANLLAISEYRDLHEIANKVAYGHSRTMPAFRQVLSESEIWKIANYVYSLKGAENGTNKEPEQAS